MTADPAVPVLVGLGVASQREEDASRAREPLDLMLDAARRAGADAGCDAARVLAGVGRIMVPKGRWRYRNAAGAIARALGAGRARTVQAEVGVLQQTLIGDVCRRIVAGEIDTGLVVGGDAGYRILRAKIAGVPLADRQQDDAPDETLAPADELAHPAEVRAGLRMAAGFYAILESALRARHGWSLDAHRDRLAQMYGRFSAIAAQNPQAWKRAAIAPEAIRDASERNPMQAFPYTRLHCSTWNVDQAGALLFCSAARARALGIAQERWIYPVASSESNHMVQVCARADLAACPGAGIAGRAALAAAGLQPADVDLIDLYSCFPVAMEIFADELGLPPGREVTVTGTMAFAGGPYNNYVLQATCRMAQLLREAPGQHGLVSSVSGLLTKQGFGVWSTQPGHRGFAHEDVSDRVAREMRTRAVVEGFEGDGAVAGYTVLHNPPHPPRGVVVADVEGGRAVAHSEDPALVARMESIEFCGARIRLQAAGTFALAA